METLLNWLGTQGGWGAAVAGLLIGLGAVWRSRESLLAKREDDIKLLYQTLNSVANTQEDSNDAITANTKQLSELAQLNSVRAQSYEDFMRRTDAALARLQK